MMRQNAKLAMAREINLDRVAATSLSPALPSIQAVLIQNIFDQVRHFAILLKELHSLNDVNSKLLENSWCAL